MWRSCGRWDWMCQTTELMTILKEAGLPVQADNIDEQECIEALEALLTR